ncbi:MAG: deoxyribodipyrimidine photo-lyase, partial [Chloroflexi bacterium]|nr:deoxyribodipyrimidine photo-lyase [Chloroflexota bacterium]
MTAPVIHWFRRDLRLADNLALRAALSTGAPVIPLFVFDPALLGGERFSAARLAFMLDGLRALDRALRDYDTRLLIRHGDPLRVIPQLVGDVGASAVYFNRDYSPYAVRRDQALEAELSIPIYGFDDAMIHPPDAITKKNSDAPYSVYTPFKKQWLKLEKPPIAAGAIEGRQFHKLDDIDTPDVPTLADLDVAPTITVPPAGEQVAMQRLREFLDSAVYQYGEGRDRLIADPFVAEPPAGTAYLSPYFRFGMLSPRQAYHAAQTAARNAPDQAGHESVATWVSELIWREFYMQILYHNPQVLTTSYRPEYEQVAYLHDPDGLVAWQQGQTGYPIVDAAMRQLNTCLLYTS